VGNSYINNIGSGFAAAAATKESADVLGSATGGDVLIRSNDRTRAAMAKWASLTVSTAGKSNAQLLAAVDSWPQELQVNKAPLGNDELCSSAKLADKSTESASCPGHAFYASPKCGSAGLGSLTANSTITELRGNGAWHLSECSDKDHCDRQQMVPLRWIASTPDLKAHGGFCSSAAPSSDSSSSTTATTSSSESQ